jgi:hypothetical protein
MLSPSARKMRLRLERGFTRTEMRTVGDTS